MRLKMSIALFLLLVPLTTYGQGTIEMPATVAGKVNRQAAVEVKSNCKDLTWDIIPTNDPDGKPLEYDVFREFTDPSVFRLRITPYGAGTYYLVVAGALDGRISEKKCTITVAETIPIAPRPKHPAPGPTPIPPAPKPEPQPIPVPPTPPEVTKADLAKVQAQIDAIKAAMPRQPTAIEAETLAKKLSAVRKYFGNFSVNYGEDNGFILTVDILDMLAAFAENTTAPVPPPTPVPVPPSPTPTPTPTPTPVSSGKLFILAFYDKASIPVPAILGDLEYWTALKTAGHQWRKIDVKNADAAPWQKYYGKVTPPSLVILDATANKFLATVPLPADRAAFDAVVKKYTGK